MDTGAEGGNVVFVKVRETYDLHTTKNKMTVIGIHTPKPDIIKRNFPGLLMQCKAYRPVSADVRVACASLMPLDVQGVGTDPGDVAPEDVFNPILYKAMTNIGMSQLEAKIASWTSSVPNVTIDISGASADLDATSAVPGGDDFAVYYGLLSNAHGWRHAMPQAGLEMKGLKPLVYEMLYNVGDNMTQAGQAGDKSYAAPSAYGYQGVYNSVAVRGNAKPLPFINCTAYSFVNATPSNAERAGFNVTACYNSETDVPWINCMVGAILVPPSKLHELFYRMVIEWTIEFTAIRPLSEVMNFTDLGVLGNNTHYANYSYTSTKEALTGDPETILENDSCMVSSNVDVEKVM